jgi:2-hydroxycyclohexanecarboxyl-CoA dehydrogenase
MRLEGRTALVTGGASGIGAATSRRLAAEGARVVVADKNLDGAKGVAGEVDGLAVTMDVTDTSSVKAGVAAGVDAFGPIEVLVNNAGTDLPGFFLKTDETMWDFVIAVNLRGVLAVTHAVLAGMHERGSGSIVNVASEAGRTGSPLSSAYSAAKAGVIGFTKTIALESARFGVRSNAIAPGPIDTPLLNAAPEVIGELGARLKQGMINATAMRRIGTPDEVAAVIAFLASDDASYVTGQTLGVSGGLSMW